MTKKEKLQELKDRIDRGESPLGLFWNDGGLVGHVGELCSIKTVNPKYGRRFINQNGDYFSHFEEYKFDYKCILSDCED